MLPLFYPIKPKKQSAGTQKSSFLPGCRGNAKTFIMIDLDPYGQIVILTGAGISKESGLATFRDDSNSIWSRYDINDVCTPAALKRNPHLVHQFYNEYRRDLSNPDIRPNAAHIALAELQKNWHGNVMLITQNIDNLHERGGSPKVLHMHGEMARINCADLHCAHSFIIKGDCQPETPCPQCKQTNILRPDVVFFGEMPYYMNEIEHALHKADLFIAIGTSGEVYPAANFVHTANMVKAKTVEINLKSSANSRLFTERFEGPATVEVPKLVSQLLALKP